MELEEVAVNMNPIFLPEHRYLLMVGRVERLLEKRNAFRAKNEREHLLMAMELKQLEKELCNLEQEIARQVI